MILILIFLLIYLNLFFLKKKKQNIINTQRLKIYNNEQKKFDIIFLIVFFIIYIIFFRVLKIFLNSSLIDLNIIFFKTTLFLNIFIQKINIMLIILIIILIFKLIILIKNIFIQNLKLSFIRLNYYLFSKSEKYFEFYINVICWQSLFWYWVTISKFNLNEKKNGIFFLEKNQKYLNYIYIFFKYISYFVLIMSFFIDIVFHENILIFFSKILPFFGIYQTIYIINKFLNNKLIARYDSCCCDYFYPPSKYKIQEINYITIIEISKYLEKIFKF